MRVAKQGTRALHLHIFRPTCNTATRTSLQDVSQLQQMLSNDDAADSVGSTTLNLLLLITSAWLWCVALCVMRMLLCWTAAAATLHITLHEKDCGQVQTLTMQSASIGAARGSSELGKHVS